MLTIAGFAAATGAVGEGLFARLNAGEATVASESIAGPGDPERRQHHRPVAEPDRAARRPGRPRAGRPAGRRPRRPAWRSPGWRRWSTRWAVPGGGPAAAQAAGLIAKDGDGFLVSRHPATRPARGRAGLLAGRHPGPAGRSWATQITAAGSRFHRAGRRRHPAVHRRSPARSRRTWSRGELIALPVSLLVMVLVFGGFLAAGMPILGAIASIGGALGTLLGVLLPDRPGRQRRQRRDGARAGPVHRLRPADRVPLPGGIAAAVRRDHDPLDQGRPDRRAGRDDVDGRPHGDVLRRHGGDQPVRAVGLPGQDPAGGRRRRRQRRGGRAAGRADSGARPCWRSPAPG